MKTCLGECGKESAFLCWKSGKCEACCNNECGCDYAYPCDESRYDNLCEAAWLRSLPEVQ